ncbi:MAG: DUF1189 family protein [bacterium]|nr:DUF1189 family protein [bacterium]
MKQLIEHIQKSIYGPAYYQELLTKPFSFSWKYFSAFALLVALFLTVVISVPLVPKVIDATRSFPPAFFAYYPDELEIRIDKGAASTNVTEPYILPIPPALKKEIGADDAFQSFVVIDTKTPFSMGEWKAYKTFVWIGKEQVALVDDEGGVSIESFGKQMDLVVNEGVLKGAEEVLRPFYKFAAPLVVLGIFLGLLIGLSVNFLYLIFGAALIFLLGRFMKQRWSYGASYRIGLHAITLPLLVKTILGATDLDALAPPYLFTAIMLAVVYVNFKGAVSSPAPLAPTL